MERKWGKIEEEAQGDHIYTRRRNKDPPTQNQQQIQFRVQRQFSTTSIAKEGGDEGPSAGHADLQH